MKWFKFYGQDFLTDSKLGTLNPFQRLVWVTLLCVASQDEEKTGIIKFVTEDRLFALAGINYDDMKRLYGVKRNETLETFCNMGLVTCVDADTLLITNYNKKQTQQSTSTERVAAWRARNRAVKSKTQSETDVTNVTLQSNGRIDKNRKEKNNNIYTSDFDAFWLVYPKKVGKRNAFVQWKKLSPDEKRLIMDDIPARSKDDKWVNGFVKDPERYLKHRQWEDEVQEPRSKGEALEVKRYT